MSRRHRLPNAGQSLVEFALVAPLLLALMFVLVELGIIFSIYIGLTNSAREAARVGAAYQYQMTNPTSTPATATVDGARAGAMNAAIMATLNPILDVTVVGQLSPSYVYEPATPTNNNYRYGDKVIVTLSYTHNLFFNLFGFPSIAIQSSSEMRLEPGGL
ncbi:MAG TPA: TadE/TadG family type IV pilus assembly protein [Herpetosiphonaceae bacterium]